MASSREYLNFILEQLSGLEEVSSRLMMGEFMLYYRGKLIGGAHSAEFRAVTFIAGEHSASARFSPLGNTSVHLKAACANPVRLFRAARTVAAARSQCRKNRFIGHFSSL